MTDKKDEIKPLYWAVKSSDGGELICSSRKLAEREFAREGGEIFCLVPRPAFTDEELDALDRAIEQYSEYDRVGLPEAEKALIHLCTLRDKLK